MSSPTGEEATVNLPVGMDTDGPVIDVDAGAAGSAGGPGKKAKSKSTTVLPNLAPKYEPIAAIITSRRPSVQKVMSDTVVAMLKLVEDINKRRDNLPSFAGTSIDEFDTDKDGKGKEKPFIPHSLRGKQPLNSSARVQNDSRCTEVLREVSTLRARAQSPFNKYRQDMAKLYKENAELEIKGRQQILLDLYIELLVIVADASVIVAKHGNVPNPTLTSEMDLGGAWARPP